MANPGGRFDQDTGIGSWTDDQGNTFTGTVADLTGGKVTYNNFRLRDAATGRFVATIGQQGPFMVQQLNSGALSVISETLPETTLAATRGDFLREVGGTLPVLTALGTTDKFEIPRIPITGLRTTWVAYPRADGTEGFTTIPGQYGSQAQIDAELVGQGFRLASPLEAAGAAIRKRLYEDTSGIVDRYIRDHGITSQGDNSAHYVAIAQMVAEADVSQLQFFSSFILE